jgi:hypothetical protein
MSLVILAVRTGICVKRIPGHLLILICHSLRGAQTLNLPYFKTDLVYMRT